MNQQTADYISLKPLADRFREVANRITNEEIDYMIREGLRRTIREQISNTDACTYRLDEVIEEWFDNQKNIDFILDTLKGSIKDKLYNNKRF